MSALIEIDGLTGGYGDTNVVFDVSARIETGQVLGVFGRNGVGKTTLARFVQGGLLPIGGRVRLNGADVTSLTAYQRRALGVGYMPQTAMVFDDLTVWENLTLGENSTPPETYFDRFPRLAERRDQPAGSLSGGERKILAFVRTISESTTLVVLDEPSEGVQPENIAHMADCLKERVANGAGVFLCEQNLSFLTRIADIYLGLDGGKTVLSGPRAQISDADIRSVLSL